ncbi:MAG: hypothetical protein ACOX8Q_07655 [Christensenellales bacterium]|jgi:hypothetical protein
MSDKELSEEKDMDELFLLAQYIDNFNIHFSLLLRRYKRFREINIVGNKDIDVITYLDIIIVQLRAICVENERYKNNYSAQVLLRKVGENALADRIENMLSQEFLEGCEDFPIRKAIKTLADDFICHYDNFDGEKLHDLSLAEIIEKQLRSPYDKINLDYIMKELINCIGEGLSVKM